MGNDLIQNLSIKAGYVLYDDFIVSNRCQLFVLSLEIGIKPRLNETMKNLRLDLAHTVLQ